MGTGARLKTGGSAHWPRATPEPARPSLARALQTGNDEAFDLLKAAAGSQSVEDAHAWAGSTARQERILFFACEAREIANRSGGRQGKRKNRRKRKSFGGKHKHADIFPVPADYVIRFSLVSDGCSMWMVIDTYKRAGTRLYHSPSASSA